LAEEVTETYGGGQFAARAKTCLVGEP